MSDDSIEVFDLERMAATTVSDYMTKKVFTVCQNQPVREALQLLVQKKITGAPVVSLEGELIGVIGEQDLLISASIGEIDSPISFTKKCLTITNQDSIKFGLEFLIDKKLKWVPVICKKKNRLVGVLARRDILKFFLKSHL